jgi:hypothetical protein
MCPGFATTGPPATLNCSVEDVFGFDPVNDRIEVVIELLGVPDEGGSGAGAAVEAELDGTATNNTLDAAELVSASAFTLPVPANVFDPPGYPTATISGRNGFNDVDFFAFDARAGSAYFDIDNLPFTFDSWLFLFDDTETLFGLVDVSFPPDPGSESGSDPFLGVIELPYDGTYYVAITRAGNLPLAISGSLSSLIRPDGYQGGLLLTGNVPGADFSFNGVQGSNTYTLHISVEDPGQRDPFLGAEGDAFTANSGDDCEPETELARVVSPLPEGTGTARLSFPASAVEGSSFSICLIGADTSFAQERDLNLVVSVAFSSIYLLDSPPVEIPFSITPACFGDLNRDKIINNLDARMFRFCFPCSGPGCDPQCDSNLDGVVNNVDALAFRDVYGSTCLDQSPE